MANTTTNTNGTNEDNTMEQILAAINNINGKIDSMQKDVESLKDDLKETKKRQDKVDERFEKMEQASANKTVKDKIKGNLKFIIPAGVVLTAAGGALAYAIYKNKNASVDVIDDVDGGDVIDM